MPDDIKPLTSISSTPLVREKRHYPGDQQQQQEKQEKKTSDEEQKTSDEEQKTSDAVAQENEVDIDGKNVRVKHIDEFV